MEQALVIAPRATVLEFVAPERRFTVGGDDIPALALELARLLPGWRFTNQDATAKPDIAIERRGDGYILRAAIEGFEALPAADLWDAGYQTTSALFLLLAGTRVEQCVIHTGGVDLGGALALFVGDTKAGKSSLALHLSAAGRRIFGDDRMIVALPMARDQAVTGMAVGLARKIRLPLPEDFAPAAIAYARSHQVGQSVEDVIYLDAAPDDIAPFGERLPVAAIVLLDRRAGAMVALEKAGAAEAMRRLIGLTMAPHLATTALLAALARLTSSVPVLRLSAPNSRTAADMLLNHDFRGAP